jgi:hypothetical protein
LVYTSFKNIVPNFGKCDGTLINLSTALFAADGYFVFCKHNLITGNIIYYHPPVADRYRMGSRAVFRAVNYSNIQIIELTVTVRRILALFEEFNVSFSTLFDSLSR